jgi:hypothetical protein
MTSIFLRAYARLLVLSFLIVGPLAAAEPVDDRSLVLKSSAPSADVENGSAYDQAEFPLGTAKRLVLPPEAEVVEEGTGATIRVFLKKTLAFAGHPPEKMSIRTGRNNLGIATRPEGDALVVGTYGEFSTKEGGASVKLRFLVPKGTHVERRPGLTGDSSLVHKGPDREPRDPNAGYWYGYTAPAPGWTRIETKRDAGRGAEKDAPKPTDQ